MTVADLAARLAADPLVASVRRLPGGRVRVTFAHTFLTATLAVMDDGTIRGEVADPMPGGPSYRRDWPTADMIADDILFHIHPQALKALTRLMVRLAASDPRVGCVNTICPDVPAIVFADDEWADADLHWEDDGSMYCVVRTGRRGRIAGTMLLTCTDPRIRTRADFAKAFLDDADRIRRDACAGRH